MKKTQDLRIFWKILSEINKGDGIFRYTQIRKKETEVSRVRTEALRKLKSNSGDFEIEHKHLDDRILKINEQQTKEIHQFRSKLDALFEPAASHNTKKERRERK